MASFSSATQRMSASIPSCGLLRCSYSASMIALSNSNIRILAPVATLTYFDTQSVDLPRKVGPVEAWNIIMERPQPLLKLAFRVRDAISSRFGVKRIGGFSGQYRDVVRVGDCLDFFLVEYMDERCMVLTERDRHLDVMTCVSTDGFTVAITSSVRVHNFFGYIYMIPVGIAHRRIVRSMLLRLQQSVFV